MTTVEKAASQFAETNWPSRESEEHGKIYSLQYLSNKEGFIAGAAWSEKRILEMLRSLEALEFYDKKSDSCSPFNGATPEELADWLEERLR